MEEYTNPYWDEIKDRLDEVTDGITLSIGLPPRREMFAHLAVDAARDILKNISIGLPIALDPVAYMEQYNRSLTHRRKDFCSKYCWAVPDPVTLDFLVQESGSSLVEMGAGTGYFAWMLSQRGREVYAYDIAPPHISTNNWYHSPITENSEFAGLLREVYFPVQVGTPETLTRHTESTLFLCWPPMSDMAVECLKYYKGSRLIYLGEGNGGCTADDAFFAVLEKEWHIVGERDPVQWDGIHDWVQVYERGTAESFTVTGKDGMELVLPIEGTD